MTSKDGMSGKKVSTHVACMHVASFIVSSVSVLWFMEESPIEF